MTWIALFLVCVSMSHTDAIPSQKPSVYNTLVNNSLEVGCRAPNNTKSIRWHIGNLKNDATLSVSSNEGVCIADGFLADSQYFETRCYRNGIFKVKIKRVNISYHAQEFYCFNQFTRTNTAFITVQVPYKYVTFKNISGDVLKAIENINKTLNCETSEGRPAANITWIKLSKDGIKTDITHDKTYAVTRKETLTERNLTIVSSSIDIKPMREDNGTRIICEATNSKSFVAKKEIEIYVQFPPMKPILKWAEGNHIVYGTLYAIRNDDITIWCHSNGDPTPHYMWNGYSEGAKLYIASIHGNTSKTCKASNEMRDMSGIVRKSSTSTTVSIIVTYPPGIPYLEFNGQTEDLNDGMFLRNKIVVKERSTFTVSCKADGFPPPEITWNQDGKTSPDLSFTNITKDSAGVYTCLAENAVKRSFPAHEVKKNTSTDIEIDVLCTPLPSPEFDLKSHVATTLNTTITFQYKAIAHPTPVFLWFKLSGTSWYRLKGSIKYEIQTTENSSNLTVRYIDEEDYGIYKVRIQNDVGSLEQMYFLNKNVPTKYVTFRNISGDVFNAIENINKTLNCETSEGRPEANITWIKISKKGIKTDITHDKAYAVTRKETLTERNLTIVSSSIDIKPMIEDNGTRIICEATNSKSFVARKEIEIYVQFPPMKPILKWAEGNYIVDGTLYAIRNDDITIWCHSNGDPTPHYIWNGYSEGTKLYIASIQENMSKTCKASNEMRDTSGIVRKTSTSTTVSIIVTYPPGIPYLELNRQTEDLNDGMFLRNKIVMKERSTFTVSCKADGFPPPEITWNQDGKTSPDLSFTNITKGSAGVYTCLAENAVKRSFPAHEVKKNTSTDIEIEVLYKSTIEKFYISNKEKKYLSEVTENNTIIFNCIVDSNPESDISLLFGETELRRNDSTNILTHTQSVTSCLDGGIYKCIANNKFNNEPSVKELKLTVRCTPLPSPEFDLKSHLATTLNMTITFQYKAIAHPTPAFLWFKVSGSSWYRLEGSIKYEIQTTENSSNLTVRYIDEEDYGVYKVRIQNDVGSLEQMYFLNVNVKEPQDSVESTTTATILLCVAAGTFGFTILAAILVIIGYIHIRRERNNRRTTVDATVNPRTSSNNENSSHNVELNYVYDQVSQHSTERGMYIEIGSITSEDSTGCYITPTF